MADYFDVDQKLWTGKGSKKIKNKETVLKVADYSNIEKKEDDKGCAYIFVAGIIALIITYIDLVNSETF